MMFIEILQKEKNLYAVILNVQIKITFFNPRHIYFPFSCIKFEINRINLLFYLSVVIYEENIKFSFNIIIG